MTDRYVPTTQDILRLRVDPNKFKVSGDEVFATLQGEGITAGSPSVFLRLQLCNLACGVNGGWKCDTGYTWDRTTPEFWNEPADWDYDYTAERIQMAWNGKFGQQEGQRIVVTGGEPLIQQKKIAELRRRLPGWEFEIETNGTIMPIPELSDCQFNCSPKLSNSGNPLEKRYKPNVLKHINKLPKSQFKFVVTKPDDFLEVQQMIDECNLNPEKILVMPEGQTAEEVALHAYAVADEVASRGWKITMRNQLIWYGSKRRT